MNPESPTPDAFDAAAVTRALAGTWCYDTDAEPTGIGYLHFTDDGRVFQFHCDPKQPERRFSTRIWCSVESSSTFRVRGRPDKEGWTCSYSFDGVTLNMGSSSKRMIPCRRITPDEAPDWFREALATRLSRP